MKVFRLSSRILLLVTVIIASFLAAFIGQVVINNLSQGPSLNSEQRFILRPNDNPFKKLQNIKEDIYSQKESLVKIYSSDGVDMVLVAKGLLATSDGWVVAVSLDKEGALPWTHIRLDSGKYLEIENNIADSSSELFFISVNSTQARPAVFADQDSLELFTPYIVLSNEIKSIVYSTGNMLSDTFNLSSDRNNKFIGLTAGSQGDLVLSDKAEVLGIVLSSTDQSKLISVQYISEALKEILKSGKISTPELGVNYIDLSQQAVPELLSQGQLKGALLSEAIPKDSSAFKAGLKLNDIILSVEGEELTKDYTLSEAILLKDSGDTIELEIIRNNKSISMSVLLD